MFRMYEAIFDCIIDNGIKDTNDVNINSLIKSQKFIDEDWNIYTPEEEKKIRKDMIHAYVAIRNTIEVMYWTRDPEKIRDRIKETIIKLERISQK